MEKKIAYGFETNVSYDFFKPPLKEIARTLLAGKGNCGGGTHYGERN